MKPFIMTLVALGAMASSSLALAQLDQQFACFERGGRKRVFLATFSQGGALEMHLEGREPKWKGTYSFTGQRISLSVPAIGWAESSQALEMHWNIPITFRTPSLSCHVIEQPTGPEIGGNVVCPTVGGTFSSWIADLSGGVAEDNTFRFYDNHHIRRFRKRVYSAGEWSSEDSDTETGIYFIEGDKIFMAFGREENAKERFLSGIRNADGSITFDSPVNLTCK